MPSLVTAVAWRHTPPAGSIHTPFAFNGSVGNFLTVPIAWLPIIESKSLLLIYLKNWTNNNEILWSERKKKKLSKEIAAIKTHKCNGNSRRFFIVHNRFDNDFGKSEFIYILFIHLLGILWNKNCSFFSERLACVFITFVWYRNGENYRAKKEKKVSEPRQEHLFLIFNCHVNDGARTKKNG